MYLAKIFITLKHGVLDPQGSTIRQALEGLGYMDVNDVRVGKYLELKLKAASAEEAERLARQMCERLLANPVLEEFAIQLAEVET